jgi:aminoglycoside phosphotransferase (APT) family kinase protein
MNSFVVPADIDINKSIVTDIVREQFNLSVNKIVLLGEGWDNAVYLINDVFVFRFPRRKEAVPLIEMEIRLLPLLQGKVFVSIPTPVFIGKPSTLFLRPFYGHPFLKGRPGSSVSLAPREYEALAHDIGLFLRQLHSINPKDVGLSINKFKVTFDRTDFDVSMKKFTSRLKAIGGHYNLKAYRRKIDTICAHARCYHPEKFDLALVHGDLYHRHLIFNEQNKLVSVIDWGDCSIADPVADLGIVYQFLPKVAHRAFFDTYGAVEGDALAYARFIGLYFAVALLWFGHDRLDQDLIKTSLRTLAEI